MHAAAGPGGLDGASASGMPAEALGAVAAQLNRLISSTEASITGSELKDMVRARAGHSGRRLACLDGPHV
jgi:hypothetical protein